MTVTIPYNAVQAAGLETAAGNNQKKCSGRGIEVPCANPSHVSSATCMSDRTRQAIKMKMLHGRSHGTQGQGHPLPLVLGPKETGGQVEPCGTKSGDQGPSAGQASSTCGQGSWTPTHTRLQPTHHLMQVPTGLTNGTQKRLQDMETLHTPHRAWPLAPPATPAHSAQPGNVTYTCSKVKQCHLMNLLPRD